MAWSKNDDQNHSKPEFMRAWFAGDAPRAVGLHFLAESWCGCHGTDGVVPDYFLAQMIPDPAERDRTVAALVAAELWRPLRGRDRGAFEIVGYLERNPSAERVRARRAARAAAGAKGANARWHQNG